MALRSEKLDGDDLGELGLEGWNDFGVLGLLLHWSFGLFGTEHVATEVRHRRLDPLETG